MCIKEDSSLYIIGYYLLLRYRKKIINVFIAFMGICDRIDIIVIVRLSPLYEKGGHME